MAEVYGRLKTLEAENAILKYRLDSLQEFLEKMLDDGIVEELPIEDDGK